MGRPTKGDVKDKIGETIELAGEERVIADENRKGRLHTCADSMKLFQYTTCGGCDTKLVSWSKWAICPECDKECYLT